MTQEIDELKMDDGITDDDKMWAALCMALGIVGVIALLMEDKKGRPFIKHHAVVGLIASIGLGVISILLSWIPIVNCISGLAVFGGWIYLVYLGVTEAYNGKWVELPFINDFAKGQGWI